MSFEKLPVDLHCQIAEFLPLSDRFQLQKCSKALDTVHRKAPIYIQNCRLVRFRDHEDDSESISINFLEFELKFSSRNNGTDFERYRTVDFKRRVERTTRFEGEDYLYVAKRCFRDIFMKKNVFCTIFTTNYMTDETLFDSSDRFSVRDAVFDDILGQATRNEQQRIDGWLKYMNPKTLEKLVVYNCGNNTDNGNMVLGNLSGLRNLQRFTILSSSEVTDEELLKLDAATEIYMDAANVTPDGVNQLIKNWTTRLVEKGSEFEYSPADMSPFTINALVKGLKTVYFCSEKAVVPVSEDRSLYIWRRETCVRIECLRKGL